MKKAFTRFPIAWRILRQHRRSGFFNHVWYLEQNPDVHSRTKRPFVHFAFHGAFEGRPPHAGFDPVSYLAANPDVVRSALPAAVHYALYGHAEKRPLVPPELRSNRQRKFSRNTRLKNCFW